MSSLRWRLASLLDRLPGQCWADLATWAGRDRGEPGGRWPWQPIGPACRRDLAANGGCYCGKLMRGASDAGDTRRSPMV